MYSILDKKDDDNYRDEKRIFVNMIVVIYSIYLCILWSIIIAKSMTYTTAEWKQIVEYSAKWTFPALLLFRDLYIKTSFLSIAFFAYFFASIIILSTRSKNFRKNPTDFNLKKWKYFSLCTAILIWIFLLPRIFLDYVCREIALQAFLSSFLIIFFLATEIIDSIPFFRVKIK